MHIKKFFFTIVLLVSSFVFSTFEEVQAETTTQTPYGVEIIPIKNQLKKDVNYFYALVEPGQKQIFSLKIKNNSQKKLTVVVSPHTARTSTGGSIDYSGIKTPLDNTLQYSFEKLCSKAQTVVLEAHEEKKVDFEVKIPEKTFNGVLLGGFYIKEETSSAQEQLKTKDNSTIALNNEYSYIVGAVLTETREENENFSFKLANIKLAAWNHQFGIQAKIVNQAPAIVSKFQMQGYISREKDQKKVYKIKEQTFSMAPNSIFLKAENVSTKDLPAGRYIYHLTIKKPETNKTWTLTKNFIVTRAETKKVLKNTLAYEEIKKQEWTKYLIISLIVILILLVAIIFYLLSRRKKV